MPASSKTDTLLAKAEPISNGGSASVITDLRRGKKPAQLQLEKRGTTLQTPRSVKKEGEEMLQVPEQIPLQPVGKTMVRQAVHLQPREVHSEADLHLQPGEDTTPEQGDARRGL